MKPGLISIFLTLICCPFANAAIIDIGTQTGIISPTSRGGANTTYFGWDLFGADGPSGVVTKLVDDITPDIGTDPGGTRFMTTNGQDHTPFSAPSAAANIYTFTGSLAESVTVTTAGVLGTGFTTIYVQGLTANQGSPTYFSGLPTLGTINGVAPTFTIGLNANGLEQFVARYDLVGNQLNYTFTLDAPVAAQHFSIDKFVVDTVWSNSAIAGDSFTAVPEPAALSFSLLALGMMFRRRRA